MATRENQCPVCGTQSQRTVAGDGSDVECPRCGQYRITRTAEVMLGNAPLHGQQATNASGWIRSRENPVIQSEDIPQLSSLRTPSIPERGDFLLKHLASRNPGPGTYIIVDYGDQELQAVTRCADVGALRFVLADYLMEGQGLLKPFGEESMGRWHVLITPSGWDYLRSLEESARSPQTSGQEAVPSGGRVPGEGEFGNRWRPIRELGAGGQGKVFLAVDEGTVGVNPEQLSRSIAQLAASNTTETLARAFGSFKDAVMKMAMSNDLEHHGALKVLHQPENARDFENAAERLRREIQAMREIEHSNLLRVLDSDPDNHWYVSEYHPRGPISKHPSLFRGNVSGALSAIRPLVEGLEKLHAKDMVHRDIKPSNIFVAADGRLVLGDFGLVFFEDPTHARLSGTFENVGSRDWMSPWTMGMKIENIRPNCDVYSLGKTLWSLVSGVPILQLWWFRKPQFNLEGLFPDKKSEMARLNALLSRCVVEEEGDCLPDASAFLREIDLALADAAVRAGSDGIRRTCVMCGRGDYQLVREANPHDFGLQPSGGGRFQVLSCPKCGNTQVYAKHGNLDPEHWPSGGE